MTENHFNSAWQDRLAGKTRRLHRGAVPRWRLHGRGVARDRKNGPGYDFVHSMVDDHSRLAYSEVLPDEKGVSCAGFLERAIDYFASPGITRIERLMTDNAFAYRKR